MVKRLVDSLKVVHDRRRLEGTVAVATLPRLVESLSDDSGNLDYAVAGEVDHQARPLLRVRVSGVVQLQCQRCLGGLTYRLNVDNAVRLVAAEAMDAEYSKIGDDPDEPECIETSSELDLTALIEDEVLLALPPYPRHEAGSCEAKRGDVGKQSEQSEHSNDSTAALAGKAQSAFSVLQALKVK